MFYFSKKSKDTLATVNNNLQRLFNEVIKYFDCTVVSGFRTVAEQQELYARGRTTPGNIVTNADGVNVKSNHQLGNAVDVVPYPEMWSDEEKLSEFGGFVLGVASQMNINIEWGGHWNFIDKPHFQTKS